MACSYENMPGALRALKMGQALSDKDPVYDGIVA